MPAHTSLATVTDNTFADDDGLGYYVDGVKRTLTDEQIDMFRHSEIQSLIREQLRRAEEAEEDTGEDGTPITKQNTAECSEAQVSPVTMTEVHAMKPEMQHHKKKKKKNKKPQHGSDQRTYRRVAREQDDVKDMDVALDYGD